MKEIIHSDGQDSVDFATISKDRLTSVCSPSGWNSQVSKNRLAKRDNGGENSPN
jgi:hypothetical protein